MSLAAAGRVVRADYYRPGGSGVPRDGVIFAHGFMRSPATMSGHARALAASGVAALVPRLPWKTDSARNALALREVALRWRAGSPGPPVERVVLVGFSAGALAALTAAREPSPFAAVVLLDPHDRRAAPGVAAARAVSVPVVLLRGAPSSCNGHGRAANWTTALGANGSAQVFPGATHCDFEAPSDALCSLLCGGREARRAAAIGEAMQRAVHDLLASNAPSAPVRP